MSASLALSAAWCRKRAASAVVMLVGWLGGGVLGEGPGLGVGLGPGAGLGVGEG